MTSQENSTPLYPIKICSNRTCPFGQQKQPVTNFYKNRSKPDGLGTYCKICSTAKTAEWSKNNREHKRDISMQWAQGNRERMKVIGDRWRENHPNGDHEKYKRWAIKNWPHLALKRCKERAVVKGIAFDMKESDLLDKSGYLPIFCRIFPHIRLDYERGIDRRLWASVDRIVPELGYISGNIWVISQGANFWKSNGSNEEERKNILKLMGAKPQKIIDLAAQGVLFEI